MKELDDDPVKISKSFADSSYFSQPSQLKLPSDGKEELMMDLKDFPLDGRFCSSSSKTSRSILHSEAVKRHRDLLSKHDVEELRDYILAPQEAPPEEYAVTSPPSSFMALIKSIIASPTLKPKPPPFNSMQAKNHWSLIEKF